MKILFTLFISLFSFAAIAQTDMEFWFAAPEVSVSTQTFDRPIMLRITAYNQASTVTISQPANGTFTPIVLNIAANATSNLDLTPWIDQIENKPSDAVLDYGLKITATTAITAYYEVVSQQCLCNPEIFVLKGTNALGTSFFIPSQNFLSNSGSYSPLPYSSFDIIATQNNTTVTITPANAVFGHAAGVAYTVTLNEGQTYSATAASQAAAQHLQGSAVTSDKPVAITVKDDLLNGAPFGGCADLGGDQIVPVDKVGTKYAVVRGFLNAPYDKVFVTATQNSTGISVDGTLVATINAGQTYMVDMPNPSRYIETSLPVYVLQLSGFGCEIGIDILPPIECTGSNQVAFSRSTSEALYLNLIVRNGGQGNFLFNGSTGIINASDFNPVPGTGGLWQFAQVTISTAQLPALARGLVSNSSDFFHMGVIHGTGNGGTRFGYFSNFNRIEVTADAFSVPVCEGFPIQLNANSVFPSATFAWTGPNNYTSLQKNPVIPNAAPGNAGDYIVTATVSGCPSTPDTVPVAISNCGQQISGIINTYTAVSGIDICKNVVEVAGTTGFSIGDRVLLIQMKGVQINTSNTTSFGDVTGYDDAGNYEFGYIKSINGNSISLVNAIQRTYTIAGFVQLVRVPQYSGSVHAVNAPVTCQPWNGSSGGIVVFEAAGTVTLSADIDASDKGFRAGVVSLNQAYVCDRMDYFYPVTSADGGRKGEGVYELPNAIINGRGKNANGGGGGNNTNSGGAGGANGGAGGRGGDQWIGCAGLPIGGDGGQALAYSNAQNKIFMGGGAGGGHQNNASASPGVNGAGIIIIKGNGITANGGAIRAYSLNSPVTAGDGAGCGGGGGTVLLDINSVLGNLSIDVHGGNGGDNNGHGVGGGGGGGVVWSKAALPGNVTPNVSAGNTGIDASNNTPRGGTNGTAGLILSGVVLPESATPFDSLPKPVATGPGSVCEHDSIHLDVAAVSNVTYGWTGPNGFVSNQKNAALSNAGLASAGDYIVAVVRGSCTERDTVAVNVNQVYSLSQAASICFGESYLLPGGTLVSATGSYTDTLQSVAGCDSVVQTTISVANSNAQSNNDTTICRNTPVQLNVTGGSYYRWRPATALSDTAIANPVATPLQTTGYIVTAFTPANNLITNGDFESGNTGFSSNYQYKAPPNTTEGQYFVGPNAQAWNGGLASCPDHTSGSGNAMLVNGAITPNQSFWCQTVAVQPNTSYAFSTWLEMVEPSNAAILQFSINSSLLGSAFTPPSTPCQWTEFYEIWNSGVNTSANICIVNQNTDAGGNDFALDDISFRKLCESSDTVLITISEPDSAIIDTSICSGSTYTRPSGAVASTAGTYTDTLQTIRGCDSIVITNLIINPVYHDTVTATICAGEAYTLPDGSTQSTPGEYTVILKTVSHCDSSITTELSVLPNSATIVDTMVCPGTAYIRPGGATASAQGTYPDTLTSANGCDSVITTRLSYYQVYDQTIADTICAGGSYVLPDGNTVLAAGTFHVTLTTVHGCDSLFTVNLAVLDIQLAIAIDNTSCFGGSNGRIRVNATGGVNPYSFDNVTSATQQQGTGFTSFENLEAGDYQFKVTDAFGCGDTISGTVQEPDSLVLSGLAGHVTCFGKADGSIQLSAAGGTTPYQYTLGSDAGASGYFDGLTAGMYNALVTDDAGCTSGFSFDVTEPDAVQVLVSPSPVVLKMGGKQTVYIASNYTPAVTYSWRPEQGLSCYSCDTVVVSALNTTTYTIAATALVNGNECGAERELEVTVVPDYTLYMPNMFSPNNDGDNDFFSWYGNLEGIKLMEVQVFNRWGEKVYGSDDKHFAWDGYINGKQAPVGVYVYMIKVTWLNNVSNTSYKGSLTLIR
jgi:gliding motility-associated-like protein